jgi:hypothetical protein
VAPVRNRTGRLNPLPGGGGPFSFHHDRFPTTSSCRKRAPYLGGTDAFGIGGGSGAGFL